MEKTDNIRFARLIAINDIGKAGIKKLKQASVLIVGCGALGSPAAMYLAGNGVGKIGIIDFDTIDISNLHRQLFYDLSQIGKSKVETLRNRILALNPDCEVECYNYFLTEKNSKEIFPKYDFIIDATDNPASKYMIEKGCVEHKIPFTTGGVTEFHGQVMSWAPGHSLFSEIISSPTDPGMMPCSINGIIGTIPGIISSIEATEAIKHFTGIGEMLYDKLFTIDLLTLETHLLKFH